MVVDGTEKTLLMIRDLSEKVQVEKILQKQEEEAEKVNLITKEFSYAFSKLCFTVDKFMASSE